MTARRPARARNQDAPQTPTGPDTPGQPPVSFAWRSGIGVSLTREEARRAWNTPWGPCARCGATHRRYGPGGGPLCPHCKAAAGKPDAENTTTERTAT